VDAKVEMKCRYAKRSAKKILKKAKYILVLKKVLNSTI